MKEIFAFDSSACAVDEAFARYRDLYVCEIKVERTGAPFFVRSRGWRLDRTLLFLREYGGVRHIRREREEQHGLGHFVLHHVIDGELSGGLVGSPIPVGPGETLLLDTREPMESIAHRVRLVTVSLARDAMRAAAGDLDLLHGRRIGAQEGVLLGVLLRALVEQVPRLSVGAHAAITRTLIELLSVALDPIGAGARSEFYRLEHVRRETVRRLIESNLGTLDFSVQHIIDATGMSRAGLYRLFDDCGGVARFIQLCRLQRLREWLDDRAFDHLPFAELVLTLGFSSVSHASRLFKRAFGIAPGAYRAASLGGSQNITIEHIVRRWDSNLLFQLR